MLLLAVDTASRAGGVAVLKDGQFAGEISTASEETYSSRLFRHLEFLLRELKLETRDFDVFAVNAGPGSFTGLRVGLTAVKAWAEVFGKPVVAVSGLEAVASQASPASRDSLIAPVLDAHRGQIYAGLYRASDSGPIAEEPEQVCTAEEFVAHLTTRPGKQEIRLISPNPSVLKPELDRWSVAPASISREIEPASTVLAPIIGKLAFDRASRGEFTDSLRLDANYVRRSDAELLWKVT
jgi:tRNA threonylcarbamoyladenosine biosynthesis protein TsaB